MGAAIIIGRDQSWVHDTASTRDSYMAFGTSIDGTVSEKMRIHINGNVGIGTATPQNTLNVVGDANVTQTMYIGGATVFTDTAGDMIFRI
jgi:hypothetical protein